MNKILKRVLIVVGIIVLIPILFFAVMFAKMSYEMRDFTPLETGNVVDNIFVVKDAVSNVFLIKDGEQYVVIDAGMNPKKIAEQIKNLGINTDNVSALLLTHTDSDHIGALSLFEKAKLYMAREEVKMINGEQSKFLWFGNNLPRSDYNLLEDREIINIGNLKVQGFLVPGHTTGMMAYLINDKYLFSGDIASLKDGKIAPIPAFFDMNHEQAVKSMEIIRDIPNAQYLITGHWGFSDYKTAVER